MLNRGRNPEMIKGHMETGTSPRDVGERMRLVREAKGFPHQGAFAKLLGVSQSRYANWEQGLHPIPYDFAIKLHALTGANLDFIYRGDMSGLPAQLVESFTAAGRKQASA